MEDTRRRVERLEERLNQAERDVATLTSKLASTKDDLSRRIDELNSLLRDDMDKSRADARERMAELKADIKEDVTSLSATVQTLGSKVHSVTESVQNLFVAQKGSSVKINSNEKFIWAVISILGSIAVYILQSYITIKGG